MIKETLGEYIHNLRVAKGLTLTKLAAALDIDQSTLSKIENNKRSLSIEILPKVATIFGLDLGVLQKEYYSEKIAELIYREDNSADLLRMAQEKTKYFKTKNLYQGNI